MNRQSKGMTTNWRTAAAILGIGILGAMLLWGFGCSRTNPELSQSSAGAEGLSWLGVRPASGDTARLLRNAHYLKMMGRPEMALRELEAAYQTDPRNIQILNTLARNYEEVGEFNRAQKIYQEALALDGSNQAVNNNLCFSYYLSGQWDKAETCFRQALAKNPQNLMARNNLGLLLCRRGRMEEARRLWQEAEGEVAARKKMEQVMVALGPGDPAAYAQHPQPAPAPVQVASAPEKTSVTPPPATVKDTAPVPLPAAKPAPVMALPVKSPAPPVTAGKPAPQQPQEQPAAVKIKAEPVAPKVIAKPVPVASPEKAASPAPDPAAPALKVREPEKLAAKPAPAPARPDQSPPASVTIRKLTIPQLQEQPAVVKTKSEPAAPKVLAKPVPAAAPEKPAPAVQAAAKPQPQPAPPQQSPVMEKKPTPAVAPPPPAPRAKTQVAAAPAPAAVTPEKPGKTRTPGIEVLNGSGANKLAQQTRTMLAGEGYRVVRVGNHRGFGVENTVIYYRQDAADAARDLSAKLFPKSKLQIGDKFLKNADIQVVLGRDLVKPAVPADKAVPAAEKIAAKTGVSQPEPLVAEPAPTSPPAEAQAKAPAPPPAPAPVAAVTPPTPDKSPRAYLTTQELETMAIDIRNGTRAKNLAHSARSMLSQEGFQVTHIGNHVDFGAEKTIIYYRAGAEKMAQKLNSRFFPGSQLEQTAKLPKNVDIKVLLGSDLLSRPDVMAKLSD